MIAVKFTNSAGDPAEELYNDIAEAHTRASFVAALGFRVELWDADTSTGLWAVSTRTLDELGD